MGFASQFETRQTAFMAQIDACSDVHGASECTRQLIDEILGVYSDTEDHAETRARAVTLCRMAKATLPALKSVREFDVHAAQAHNTPAKSKWLAIWRYAPGALSMVLAVWLYLSGQTNPSFVALACAFITLLAARERVRYTPPIRYEVTARVNAHELTRQLGFVFREIDMLLPEQGTTATDASAPSTALLEATQMLMEAQLTQDGAYALKSVPQLVDASTRQGVYFSRYEEGAQADFDLLPGAVDGATIRPAVRKDDALLLRGQATVKR